MNPKTLESKKKSVAELKERLASAKCVLIMSYQGLNVKTFTQLRKALHNVEIDGQHIEAGVEVRKNTLVKRALEEENDKELENLLTGANALITCDDPLAALSVVTQFCDDNHKFAQIKGGLIEHTFMNEAQLAEIGACGSRNGIYSMLLSVLEAGMRNLAMDIKLIAEKNGGTAEQPAEQA